jgi:hypothetical protein
MSATSWLILTTIAFLTSLINANAGYLMTLYNNKECSDTPTYEQTIQLLGQEEQLSEVPSACIEGKYTEEGNVTSVGIKVTECTENYLGMALYPATVDVQGQSKEVNCIRDALADSIPDLTIGFLKFDLAQAKLLFKGECAIAKNTCCEDENPGKTRAEAETQYYKLDKAAGFFPSCSKKQQVKGKVGMNVPSDILNNETAKDALKKGVACGLATQANVPCDSVEVEIEQNRRLQSGSDTGIAVIMTYIINVPKGKTAQALKTLVTDMDVEQLSSSVNDALADGGISAQISVTEIVAEVVTDVTTTSNEIDSSISMHGRWRLAVVLVTAVMAWGAS